MDNNPKKYNEYNVSIKNGKIDHKWPTARKQVSIYPHEAEIMNSKFKQQKLYYELAEAEPEAEKAEASLFDELTQSDINALNAEEAKDLALQNGASEEEAGTGKAAKQFLINLKK